MGKFGLTRFITARTWGSHHLSPYSTICASTRPTSKWYFVPGLPNGSTKIRKVESLATLGSHNFVCRPLIELRSKAKLYPLSRFFQQYVARHLHARKSGRFPTFNQTTNLIPDLSFGHNLCFRCINGSCEPILDI
jgi:hypothetical protein